MLSYFQAIVIGLLQGVTELFPISSLGHSVLLPAWLGWHGVVRSQSASESFYLAFIVALHVGTALALFVFFWDEWVRIIGAFFTSIRNRSITTADERLAWLLVVATIPAGLMGLLFEHALRTLFAKPLAASIFLTINGAILLLGERYRRMSRPTSAPTEFAADPPSDGSDGAKVAERAPERRLATLEWKEAGVVGVAQVFALLAGISRSGITMVAGLVRGLDHEDAARFSFLLATPIIFAAGVYKIPDLTGHLGNGVRGQAFVGALVALVAAYISVRFLMRWFETKTLWPFGIYCLLAGGISIIRFA
jgi:undecaprenyl-diphosphatase